MAVSALILQAIESERKTSNKNAPQTLSTYRADTLMGHSRIASARGSEQGSPVARNVDDIKNTAAYARRFVVFLLTIQDLRRVCRTLKTFCISSRMSSASFGFILPSFLRPCCHEKKVMQPSSLSALARRGRLGIHSSSRYASESVSRPSAAGRPCPDPVTLGCECQALQDSGPGLVDNI